MLEEDGEDGQEMNGRGWRDTPVQLQATGERKEKEKEEGEGGRV